MVPLLAVVAVLWFGGAALGVPRQARWLAILLFYIAILGLLTVLPDDLGPRQLLGGSRDEWLALGLVGLAVWAYSMGLRRLRGRVRPENRPVAAADGPSPAERYARHIVLREIGGQGQARLRAAKVLVVGAGGLGSPALLYLAGAGVGTLGVIDDDTVDPTNLQRQIIHTEARTGMPKVFSAQTAISALNPLVELRPYHRRLTPDIAEALVADYDLVLDGTDGADTRYDVNRAAVAAGVPLVSAALSQWEGQISLFDPARDAPCYACVFPVAAARGLAPSCAEGGVLGPLPGVMGAMMAVEAVKEIVGAGQGLRGRLLIYDALWGETRTIAVRRRADCPVCGAGSGG